jgi:LmbE family N-acetylglucosaminyl deacetylase
MGVGAKLAVVRHTCVFFHAHPDDEALLTSGTMARLAAEGNRVVLVVATAGERGLSERDDRELAGVRLAELHASATALGCARVVSLDYRDSGLEAVSPDGFAVADPHPAAIRLADLLRDENAGLLTVYDPAGGYGHPDHVQVHRVGTLAAELAGTPRVLQATVDRTLLLRALRLAGAVYRFPPEFDLRRFETAYSPRSAITHRVNVRHYIEAKRASMAAHASQATGGDSERTLAALLRLPRPVFRLVMGTEWYVRPDLPAGRLHRHPLEPG